MEAFLLTWNSKKTYWFEDQLIQWDQTFAKSGKLNKRGDWSCGVTTKSIRSGARVFLIKLGSEPRGIVASGYAISEPYKDRHWLQEGKQAWYVDVKWDVALDPREAIFELEKLKKKVSDHYNWCPQASGQSIDDNIAARLEKEWNHFVRKVTKGRQVPPSSPEQIKQSYEEGTRKFLTLEQIERNRCARNACIRHYGLTCQVCGFNFAKVYGEIGEGFIHVHHVRPLCKSSKPRKVDPIRDLIPVCPNCHEMLHQSKQAMRVEKLRQIVEQNKSKRSARGKKKP